MSDNGQGIRPGNPQRFMLDTALTTMCKSGVYVTNCQSQNNSRYITVFTDELHISQYSQLMSDVCEKLVQETSIKVAYTIVQATRTRNTADDGDDDLAVVVTSVLSTLTTRTSNQ